MRITSVETFLVEIPQQFPIAPYQSRYRATSATQSLLVRLGTDNGLYGWGEAPQRYLGEQLTGHEAHELRPRLIGWDPADWAALYADAGLDGTYVQSAVEMALWDLLGQQCGQPLHRLLGGLYRDRIELAACMGIRPPHEAAEIARLYVQQGFTTLKTKAGRDPQEDLTQVRAIRDAVGDRLQLRIDPNTGYSPDVCLELARALEPYGLQYLEQPMAADRIADAARIRKLTRTPLALNESVSTLSVVRQILHEQAADVLLPDTHQCGGIWAVKLVAEMAASAGVPCVMHCSHDLGPKTAAMLHLAASTPSFSLANDCTYYGLLDDILTQRLPIESGYMAVPRGPGLGIQVDLAKVRQYQVGPTA
jgi:L-alanine-DL-glutamate epimerase-like enolase superfamily enzyme